MYTIVSVTPVALEKDSRTLKLASSFARWGYQSIVVEGNASSERFEDLGIRLVSLSAGVDPERKQSNETGSNAKTEILRVGRQTIWRRIGSQIAAFIRKTPAEPVMDMWTLLLHLKHLWIRTGYSVAQKIPKADLFYVHAFDLWPAVWTRRFLSRKPVIYDAHDFYLDLLLDNSPNRFTRVYVSRMNSILERSLSRSAVEMVTVSPELAENLKTQLGRDMVVVRNCHDSDLDKEDSEVTSIRIRAGLEQGDVLAVVIGNAKPGQAMENLIESVSQSPDTLHLALIGSGYEQFAPAIKDNNLGERVHLMGRISPREIVPAVRTADFSILVYTPRTANYFACLPNGFFQSVAAGLPLVYPLKLPSIAALSKKYGLGWGVDPADVRELTRVLETAHNDSDARKTYSANAIKAYEDLCWRQESERLRPVIASALGHH